MWLAAHGQAESVGVLSQWEGAFVITRQTLVTLEHVEEMPNRRRSEDEPLQETIPVTIRIPQWMFQELEDAGDREQRQLADIMRRLLARAVRDGWTRAFEAVPLSDQRPAEDDAAEGS